MASGQATIRYTSPIGVVSTIAQLPDVDEDTIWVETRDLAIGEVQTDRGIQLFGCSINSLIFEVNESDDLSGWIVYVATKERMNDELVWRGPYYAGDSDRTIFFDVPEGRYLRYKLFDMSPSALWKLTAFEAYGARTGISR